MAALAGLCLAWSETPEDTFFHGVAQLCTTVIRKPKTSEIHQMSLVMRKPVFGVCDQIRLQLACSASEASYSLENAEQQADLRLCCSYMAKAGFDMTWPHFVSIVEIDSRYFV